MTDKRFSVLMAIVVVGVLALGGLAMRCSDPDSQQRPLRAKQAVIIVAEIRASQKQLGRWPRDRSDLTVDSLTDQLGNSGVEGLTVTLTASTENTATYRITQGAWSKIVQVTSDSR